MRWCHQRFATIFCCLLSTSIYFTYFPTSFFLPSQMLHRFHTVTLPPALFTFLFWFKCEYVNKWHFLSIRFFYYPKEVIIWKCIYISKPFSSVSSLELKYTFSWTAGGASIEGINCPSKRKRWFSTAGLPVCQ